MRMSKRKKDIISAITRLGGRATTEQIANELGLNINGVAQTLACLDDYILPNNYYASGKYKKWYLRQLGKNLS